MMETRPKLTLILSPLDKTLEWLCLVLLFTLWALAIYVYVKMPAIIPTHFNALGKPDAYGDKTTIFMLPVVTTIIYAGMTALNKVPNIFNYLSTITPENAREQYSFATRMLRFIKLMVLLIFNSIVLFTYGTVTGFTNGLGGWLLPMIFSFSVLPIIYLVFKFSKTGNQKK